VRLAAKVSIITGGGSGIGEATAKLFAREGARVAVVDVNAESGARVASEIGEAGLFIHADVTKAEDMQRTVQTVTGRLGAIDILFNNAGISCVGTLDTTTEQEWDRVMNVNLKGVYFACKSVIPVMVRQNSGCIINMASGVSLLGLPKRAAYTASKGAVLSLTRSMQVDYVQYGIRVNALVPGTIYTPFVEGYLRRHYSEAMDQAIENLKKRQLCSRLGTPEDVAYACLYLASDEAKFVYGTALVVDGGYSAAKIF
jgi:NAD(P)-dependent dehydrogenase (short-subunit alcohol dehydrogenase family)